MDSSDDGLTADEVVVAATLPITTKHRNGESTNARRRMDWTVDRIERALADLAQGVSQGHARLVDFVLEEAEKRAPQPRHLSTVDAFADMKSTAIDSISDPSAGQHSGDYGKSKGNGRRAQYPVLCLKPDREPVPGYRFHHVEIRKNILAPNSMLNFVPHLRDVDPNSAEEQKYSAWLMDLESLDSKSGFQIQNRAQKLARRAQNEYAATLAPYLESWLQKLAIDGCTKSTLIRYMASQPQNEDAITPQQKSNLLDTHSEDIGAPHAVRGAKLFTEAFDRVFNNKASFRRVALRDILMLDKSVEPILENKRAKDGPSSQKPRDEALMQKIVEGLGSYSTLGCLICFSHDCEHGEIERDNQKRCFSLEEIGGLAPTLRRKWIAQVQAQKGAPSNGVMPHPPCKNQCYQSSWSCNLDEDPKPWLESEVSVLEWTFASIGYSKFLDPQCFVAAVLGRYCWDVHHKLEELDLSLPPVEPRAEQPKPKAIPWYDRRKKQLLGDWQDATITHEHARQKEGKPCICIQLNRECDPVLCKGCGAKERADPENAYDEQLHSTGCQNVALQRGAPKTVLLGKSQLECCGYGLFAAEDVAQDDFVIEYTGELISHDEGVRRENRRGDVFDEENKVSYLFTLLEQEGIWVDAAIYGNLSRYINHASDNCNIMPRIMYVNHEFRIKFLAIRDIKAGEELFFNYGDNFPNLTKKLVERNNEKANDSSSGSAPGPKRKSGTQRPTARKTTSKAKGEGIDFAADHGDDDDLWLADMPIFDDDDVNDDWGDSHPRKRKKQRGGRRPGAGRKRKQPEQQPRADDTDDISPGLQLRIESNDAHDDSVHPNTPTRRRAYKRSQTATVIPQSSFSGSEGGDANTTTEPSVKKVSKRGGARPGAGRKPKHRSSVTHHKPSRKSTAHSSLSSMSSLNNDTDKVTPKRGAQVAASTPRGRDKPTARRGRRGGPRAGGHSRIAVALGVAGRKRKVAEVEDEDSRITATEGLYCQDTFQPIDDSASASGSRGRGGTVDDDDDEDDVADRSARRRQKPLRYRDEKE
ncbi:hypothetical protein N0V88_004781 [Collariella sp. IMI 366227]|nr:hypothetical protein N0V88_004781 [Collariella sp. IMI 366227]